MYHTLVQQDCGLALLCISIHYEENLAPMYATIISWFQLSSLVCKSHTAITYVFKL